MRIAFVSRSTIFSVPGGDTTQMMKTAESLQALGISVDVYRNDDRIDYSRYDLLHFFNIIRPADILAHTARSGRPYVVSTIFVEYDLLPGEKGVKALLQKVLGNDRTEWLKAVARRIKNGEKIRSVQYLIRGHRAAVKKVARNAAMLLPNSESEYRRFVQRYGLQRPCRIVPNGIDLEAVSRPYGTDARHQNAVVCMGRLEPLKNQLRLIQALKGAPYKVIIHGRPAPNHAAYYQACKAAAGDNVEVAEYVSGDSLYAAYASARVHALSSYFETTGLASLEAAAMGCNIVVTRGGDQPAYFHDDAWYCEPDDAASIRAAVDAAFAAPFNEKLRQRILREYTWKRAAEETLNAYRQILP